MEQPTQHLTDLEKLHNRHFSIEDRWEIVKKELSFVFSDQQCYCELDWIATEEKPNRPPNLWCQNPTYWKTQSIPCCCRNFCDAKIDLIALYGPCECSRCCPCQVIRSQNRCENCSQKDIKYQKCKHINHHHTPCLFYSKLFQILDDMNVRDNLHNVLMNDTSDDEYID